MKKILSLFMAIFVSYSCYSQCNEYFELAPGDSWEMTSYNAKGKNQGKTHQRIADHKEVGDGYEATIMTTVYDQKDKQQMQSEFLVSCIDNIMRFDMQQFMAPGSMDAYQNMKMKMSADNLEYPSNLSVGDELKSSKINMKMEGPMTMNFFIEIKDRKVVGKEAVTTPAGTFDCYKISSTMSTKTMAKIEVKSVEWLAKGRGVVKTESYNKNGKLMGYTLLTKVN